MRVPFAALGLALLADTALAACDPGERVIKFSHVVAEKGHPKGEAAAEFAARVNADLDGRVCVEVYPSSTLMPDDETLFAALATGEVQMAAPSIAKMGAISSRFMVFDLPFLFPDLEAVTYFQTSDLGQDLLGDTRDAGMVGFTYWHNGLTQMSAKRPVVRPEDARGLTFRISGSPVSAVYYDLLGAGTKKLKFSAVYDALKTGEVDGQENTWSNIYTKRFYTVQDSVTETNHRVIAYMVLGSLPFFESLPAADREAVERILTEVTHEYNRFAYEMGEYNKQRTMENGGRVNRLSAEDVAAWRDALAPVYQRFEARIGADLIRAAQAAGTR